jgi:hypothetical protein
LDIAALVSYVLLVLLQVDVSSRLALHLLSKDLTLTFLSAGVNTTDLWTRSHRLLWITAFLRGFFANIALGQLPPALDFSLPA